MPQTQVLQDIYGEMYRILEHFQAMSDVLAPLGSASDGEWPDEDVLDALQRYRKRLATPYNRSAQSVHRYDCTQLESQ